MLAVLEETMRKSLLALVALTALLLSIALVGCGGSSSSDNGTPATPPAEGGTTNGDDGATSENPFIGVWKSAEGFVEYRADGTWIDGADLPDGTFTAGEVGTYEVVAADGYYELREFWEDLDADPMVFYVVFDGEKAGFFETLTALEQGEIVTTYTQTAPGVWER